MTTTTSDQSAASVEPVLEAIDGSQVSIRKRICRPSFRLRKLSNRGALLVLVWNFLITSVFYYLSVFVGRNQKYYTLAWCLTLPLAGWLADMYCSRHKLIRWSIWTMWVTSVLTTLSFVVAQLVEGYHTINEYVAQVLLILMALGFGGYQANIVMFGIDQLHDAATEEITSFISWYVWTYQCSWIFVYLAKTCLFGEYKLFRHICVCACLSVALGLSLIFQGILLKEPPATQRKPFQLIYKVVKYAVRTKHPRLRSAFTYCEDELPSRMDFGKSKYGGPFTIEQVEDVKTFLRMLVIIIFASAVNSGIFALQDIESHLLHAFNYFISVKSPEEMRECISERYSNQFIFFFTVVISIPLYEFAIYPLLHKQLYWMKSSWKVLMGAALQMARIGILCAFELTARHNYLEQNGRNATIECVFKLERGALSSTFNTMWIILPDVLNYMSAAIYGIGAFEFICSQSPYAMRGLLIGAAYGCVVLFNLIVFGIVQPFTKHSAVWGVRIISCGFWYLLCVLLLLSVGFAALVVVMKWYRYRKREDVLPNEQVFAERYYSK